MSVKGIDSSQYGGRLREVVRSVVMLLFVAALTAAVFIYRDEISSFASMGYLAVFGACFLLNSGVFGLSPSGMVAAATACVLNPVIVALVAGLGAGLGEVTSYFAGKQTSAVIYPKYVDKFDSWGPMKVSVVSFIASLVSGNLSDAVGLVCGRLNKSFAAFMAGATAAKTAKMFLIVFVARQAIGALGVLG